MEWNDKFNGRLRACFDYRGTNLSFIKKEKAYVHFFPGPPWDIISGKIVGTNTYTLTLTMGGNEEITFHNLKIADIIKAIRAYRG